MAENRSKLLRLFVRNIGCIGNDGLSIELDDIVCLVGVNNSGKSTILRAYELAKGTVAFDAPRDRCKFAPEGEPSEVQLEVHIPDGIANVHEKWKAKRDDKLVVKSRWQWDQPSFGRMRTTWDPAANDGNGAWADENAAGLDNVFGARLPRPIRIGSLEDADKTAALLLDLSLAPLVTEIEKERKNPESQLATSIQQVTERVKELSGNHEEHFNKVADRVSLGFKGVFPALEVRLNIGAGQLIVSKLGDSVKSDSGLEVIDGPIKTSLAHQGTGARRALFWSMLQVHNEMARDNEARLEYRKYLEKTATDFGKKAAKAKADAERDGLNVERDKVLAQLHAHDAGAPIPEGDDDPAFPGYLLLIDEPENALHPMAARAAQKHLYSLAQSPDWQVILTTHSPYFINPFEDHTTIVRLARTANVDGVVSPQIYVADTIAFDGDEKARLQALQQIDPSFSEVFFGSYPIVVEGDTEHAAFLAAILEREHALAGKVTIVRARGKAILVPLIKVLTHFKIDFGLLHDADSPFTRKGTKNAMWTENEKIGKAIEAGRAAGLKIRHRVSIPDFERLIEGDEESKDKPLTMYRRVTSEDGLSQLVQQLMQDLYQSDDHQPFGKEKVELMPWLESQVLGWAKASGVQDELRFKGKEEPV